MRLLTSRSGVRASLGAFFSKVSGPRAQRTENASSVLPMCFCHVELCNVCESQTRVLHLLLDFAIGAHVKLRSSSYARFVRLEGARFVGLEGGSLSSKGSSDLDDRSVL